jgi:hypothetical protein
VATDSGDADGNVVNGGLGLDVRHPDDLGKEVADLVRRQDLKAGDSLILTIEIDD